MFGHLNRRLTFQEFTKALSKCKLRDLSIHGLDAEARRYFENYDKYGDGTILFDDFCQYVASRKCPEGTTNFTEGRIFCKQGPHKWQDLLHRGRERFASRGWH